MNKAPHKAVFIDKDGTLIPDLPYNADPTLITLEDDLIEGLRSLQENGYLLVIISNQAGIAHGYFTEHKLVGVRAKIKQLLEIQSVHLDGFYHCPHHPDGLVKEYAVECICRKPKPGLLLKASSELDINLLESWMIGDILNDVEAGNRAGCSTVLINNGNETEWVLTPERKPDFVTRTINEAAAHILKEQFQSSASI